jgi:elongation factor G
MGELHLEILIDRMLREFRVQARVVSRRWLTAKRLQRKSHRSGNLFPRAGGRGQYGHALVTLAPNERGKGVEIENKIVGGAIPKDIFQRLSTASKKPSAVVCSPATRWWILR